MSDTIDAGDGRSYVLDETLHPVGVEDDNAGVSRAPTAEELAHDFPHGSGLTGVQGVYNDQGELVGAEDDKHGVSQQFTHESPMAPGGTTPAGGMGRIPSQESEAPEDQDSEP